MSEPPRSIDAIQDEIVEEMSRLDGWLEKYEYLVALGRETETPGPGLRTEEHAVPGCQAMVWLRAERENGRIRLFADSEAMITKGIISLLVRVLDDQPPDDVVDAELHFLDRTGLRTHLSPSRANGLATVVERIREYAGERGEDG